MDHILFFLFFFPFVFLAEAQMRYSSGEVPHPSGFPITGQLERSLNRTAVRDLSALSQSLATIPPLPHSSDLHFNVRGEVSGTLLKRVRMINHLKSKILITGCNFSYLRSPLVSWGKKRGGNTTGYSPSEKMEEGGENGGGEREEGSRGMS